MGLLERARFKLKRSYLLLGILITRLKIRCGNTFTF